MLKIIVFVTIINWDILWSCLTTTVWRDIFVGKIFRGFHGFEKIIHENKGIHMVHCSIFAKP